MVEKQQRKPEDKKGTKMEGCKREKEEENGETKANLKHRKKLVEGKGK